jgi:predicted nucleic acid-binding Zn finger protein
MATSDSIDTPATTERSVKAACERMATAQLAPGMFLVDNGDGEQYVVEPDLPACTCSDWEYRSEDLGDDGCKHIRRVRMVRGEIDLDPLLESDARVDDLLLRNREVSE